MLSVVSFECDTDPSSLEEKHQSIRHQGGSQMKLYICSVKSHRPTDSLSSALKTIDLPHWTSWILYLGGKNTSLFYSPMLTVEAETASKCLETTMCYVFFCVPVISSTVLVDKTWAQSTALSSLVFKQWMDIWASETDIPNNMINTLHAVICSLIS